MGNNQPQKGKQGTIEYQRFGWVAVKQATDAQTGQKIEMMQFTRSLENQDMYKTWQQQITRINDSQAKQVLLLPETNKFQKAGFCGSAGLVHLTYQNYPYVLDSQIKNRKKLNRYFMETEMWYLLYNIIRAGKKFQLIKKKIGDVSPHNIVINDDGQIKVISQLSVPKQQNNFQKIVEDKTAIVYLAPQELDQQAISNGKYPANVDPWLTILSSGILQDCFDIYSRTSPRTINQPLLNQYIGLLKKQNYSQYLFNTIVSMLVFQPNMRRQSSEIYKQLYQYENLILDLEPFEPIQQSTIYNSNYQSQIPVHLRQTGVIGSIPQGAHGYLISQAPASVSQTYSSQFGTTAQRNNNFVDPIASNYR